MSNALATTQSNVVPIGGDAWNEERREFIRRTFCAGAPDEFVEPFLKLCERRNLSPEANHIYLVPRWDNKNRTNKYVPQVSIDGYRLMAARTGQYAGSDEPVYLEGEKHPVKATVTVYKVVGGVRCPFTASAYWEEYVPGERQDFMWRKMPHVMLAKVAEAAALRKAFPEDLSGFYTTDEMEQAQPSIREIPTEQPHAPQIASTAPTANDMTDFEDRLADALEMVKEPQKRALNNLQKEAMTEKHPDKLRLLIKFVPDFAMAEWILNTAADKHGVETPEMIVALTERDDNPNIEQATFVEAE